MLFTVRSSGSRNYRIPGKIRPLPVFKTRIPTDPHKGQQSRSPLAMSPEITTSAIVLGLANGTVAVSATTTRWKKRCCSRARRIPLPPVCGVYHIVFPSSVLAARSIFLWRTALVQLLAFPSRMCGPERHGTARASVAASSVLDCKL